MGNVSLCYMPLDSSDDDEDDIKNVRNATLLTVTKAGHAEHPLWSVREVFSKIRVLLKTTHKPTMEPMFVRPTTPELFIYVADLLRIFLVAPRAIAKQPVRSVLCEDAARKIACAKNPKLTHLDVRVVEDQKQLAMVVEAVLQLIDLNLVLPPESNHPLTPLKTMSDVTGGAASNSDLFGRADEDGGIPIGWISKVDQELEARSLQKALTGGSSSSSRKGESTVLALPVLLAGQQSEDCVRWNAALGFHKLIAELARIDPTHLLTSLYRWEGDGKHGRVLVVKAILQTLDFKDVLGQGK